MNGWIGVDLDGTLAIYDGYSGPYHIGAPVPKMLKRVIWWLNHKIDVRIFTARATVPEQLPGIRDWCLEHIGMELPITATKDFDMIELWDDRCISIEPNSGRILSVVPLPRQWEPTPEWVEYYGKYAKKQN